MIKLNNIEHIELWVENAREVSDCYQNYLGFKRIAEAGPETGLKDHYSIVLKQGSAKLIITSSTNGKGSVAEFVSKHGDGVRDIAFAVDNVCESFDHAIASGAVAVEGSVSCFGITHRTICAFGDVVHTFIEANTLAPFFNILSTDITNPRFCIQGIDHIAMCLDTGELDKVANFYKKVLNFVDGQREYVETEYSGMNSRVVMHNKIKFPLQEPLKENPSGPIYKFLKLNDGPGVYHAAFLTSNIYTTMQNLSKKIAPLDVPDSYYEQLPNRIKVPEKIEDLKKFKILVDGNIHGYLMQVFTRSAHPRYTFYIEIIQRINHDGFGSGNVRALFDAIEADQRKINV